jgi:hypothetical protein
MPPRGGSYQCAWQRVCPLESRVYPRRSLAGWKFEMPNFFSGRRRLGSVCQDTGRPRSDHADHGVCRTMAQGCSAPAPIVEGVSHQSARKKGLRPAPRRVTRRRHRLLPVSNLSFPYRLLQSVPPASFFPQKLAPSLTPFSLFTKIPVDLL